MSDHSITIAPKQSNYPNAEEKAKELLSYLISKDIVKDTLSDCTLCESGYAISKGVKSVTNEPEYLPFDLTVNGLSITTVIWTFQ